MTWHRRRQSTTIDAKGIRLGVMAEEETSKRTRKSPQERRAEVLDAAVQLISERGFNGISIQDVADRVGISKQGVLRYVGSKDNMLAMVFNEYYGQTGTPEDFFASGMPGSNPTAPVISRLPALSGEAQFPPAHDGAAVHRTVGRIPEPGPSAA